MAERKSLSKKTRFEVFKRDSFTCQYCGAKAPDVILEVDHINPVSKGGDNDILNLVTSCMECNRGKGKDKLSESSLLEKQRAQIEELNIRRMQLEMMLEWRDGVISIESDIVKVAIDNFNSKFYESKLSELGEKKMKALVKKFGLQKTLDKTEEVFDKYFDLNKAKEDEASLFLFLFEKLGAFLIYDSFPEHRRKIAYLKGIIKNKSKYFNERKAHIIIEDIYRREKDSTPDILDVLIEGAKKKASFSAHSLEHELTLIFS